MAEWLLFCPSRRLAHQFQIDSLPFGVELASGMSFRGLALANSVAALVEAGVLLRFIAIRMPGLTIGRLATPTLRILAAWRLQRPLGRPAEMVNNV